MDVTAPNLTTGPSPFGGGTVSERIATFVAKLKLEALPSEVVHKAKLLLLDTVGVCVGSAQLGDGQRFLRQCAAWSGSGSCTLIGSPERVGAQYAAWGNGALGHGQDYDDTHTETILHPSCVLVPALLAAAERDDTSGAEALVILAGVTEAVIALAMPAGGAINRRGFQASSSLGAFGAALIAARTGGFGPDRTADALGIAGSFASGLMECVPAAAASKQFQPGWGGFCGITAADLAKAGFSGPKTVFEGRLGYFAAFLNGMAIEPEDVFRGLGETWEILNVRPKLYPCAHNVHGAIECAAALRDGGRLRPEDIASILCEPPQGAVAMVCEPWDRKIAPATGYDGRFSLAYVVAVMLATGSAGPDSYTDELVHDPVIRGLMARTTYRVNPDFQFRDMPGRVTVTLSDGTVRTHEVPQVRGHAANPIGTEELMAKFDAGTTPLGSARAERVKNMVMGVEMLPSIRVLMAELGSAS